MNKYNRYMLFTISEYYPSGGLGDCVYSGDSKRECKISISDYIGMDWYIFDRVEGIIVVESKD